MHLADPKAHPRRKLHGGWIPRIPRKQPRPAARTAGPEAAGWRAGQTVNCCTANCCTEAAMMAASRAAAVATAAAAAAATAAAVAAAAAATAAAED